MKPKTMILMVVAVACGLGASFMTSRYLKAARAPQDQSEPTVPVLVAKTAVPSWTAMKEPEKLFEVKQMPQSAAPKNPISDPADIKDQRLKTLLVEGTALSKDHLLSKEQNSLADQLAPGQRAMAIKVNTESAAAGFVLPGTRVDILWTIRGQEAASEIILQSVLVLAVDANDTRTAEQRNVLGQTVTMALTPEEAAGVTLASSLGELRLLLKSQGDTTNIGPVRITPQDLQRRLNSPKDKEKEEEDKQKDLASRPIAPTVLSPIVEETKEEKARAAEKEREKAEPRAAPKAAADEVVQEKRPEKRHRTLIIGSRETVLVYKTKKELDDEERAEDGIADDEEKPASKREEKKDAPRPRAEDKKKDEPKSTGPASAYGKSATRTPRSR